MGISSTLFFQISCSGLFELRLSSFKNELGRDSLDHCCSGYRTSSGKCSGVCRTSFRVCLKHFQNNIDPKPPCTYGDIITPVLANNSVQFVDSNHNNKRIITGFTNPIVFPFEFSWPGTFSLIIEAWHELSESEYSQRSFQGEGSKSNICILILQPSALQSAIVSMGIVKNPTSAYVEWDGKDDRAMSASDTQVALMERATSRGNATATKSSETNYTCTCAVGFHGRHCEISSASTCSKNPCQNQGTCLDRAGGYRCLCHTGFSGINCEMQRDDCHPNPCVNGGSCVSRPHGFKCICPAGYNGMFCEKNINDCAKTTCMNGGTCIDSINSFKCLCVPGYMGSLCQTNVNDCLTKPCANGGLCHDLVNDYKCTCRPGFTGKDCSINIDECASNPCQHGGTCEDRVDEFVCHCLNGYIGSRCELSDGTTYVRLDANRPQVTKRVVDVSRRVSEEQERKPANTQVILISTLACVVPLLILVCLIVICMFKARRRREREVKDAEDAQIQNEQNLVNSKNNKLKDNHQIINTLDRPSGKMLKINNEDSNSLYNKDCNTIPSNVQRISKLLNIDSTSTSNKIHNDSVSVRTPSIDSSSFHNNKQNSLSSSSTTNSHRNLRNEGESDRLEKQWVCLESCSRMTNGESSGHFGQLGKVNEAVNVPTFI
ncbi:Neurogenic locus protein delta [Nymphon striatum]|nr:Neurogenic locus protein delta [Nymphon striatum]